MFISDMTTHEKAVYYALRKMKIQKVTNISRELLEYHISEYKRLKSLSNYTYYRIIKGGEN